MLTFIGGGVLIFGGAAIVFEVAGNRERDGSLWAFLSIAVSGLLSWFVWRTVAGAEEPALWMGFAPIAAAFVGHACVAAVVLKLPIGGAALTGDRWPMTVLSGPVDAGSVVLELGPSALRLSRLGETVLEIAAASITDMRGDAEALVLELDDASGPQALTLLPAGAVGSREARMRFIAGLVARLEKHLG